MEKLQLNQMFVQEKVNVMHQINVHVTLDTLVQHVNSLSVMENNQMIHKFVQLMEHVQHLTTVLVQQVILEINVN